VRETCKGGKARDIYFLVSGARGGCRTIMKLDAYGKAEVRQLDRIKNLYLKELMSRCVLENKLYAHTMKKMFDLENPGDIQYEKNRKERIEHLKKIGVRVRNYGKSFYVNRISYGCLVCPHWYRKGYLLDVAQSCNRKCFFCYHDRLPKVDFIKKKNMLHELYRDGARRVLSIGSSEPLLAPQRVYASLKTVHTLTRGRCYTFLYTNGDLLTRDILKKLKENSLDEIRISIKPGESSLRSVILAKDYIRNVMVEMPIFPNDEHDMKKLLLELNKLRIFGINLSHLLCTRANKDNLKARGYKIISDEVKPWYESFYPYELSVYGSEETCFSLLEFAVNKKIRIGVHYCSNDNFRSSMLNERLCLARGKKRPYEAITKYGLLKKLVVYRPDYIDACRDLKRSGIPNGQYDILADKKRLETSVKNLGLLDAGKYEIGTLYALPDGREVNIKICSKKAGIRKKRMLQDEERSLKIKIAAHVGHLMMLEGRASP
jgi:uncharacterized protein